jgi:copper resistance protein B
MDDMTFTMVLIDQLEHSLAEGDSLRLNGEAWIGGDYSRFWLKPEATFAYGEDFEDVDVQALYGRLLSPYWDLQAGLRYSRPTPDGPSRASAVIGIQGLAPHWFEVQAAAFVSHKGEVSARVELEYDLLVTQRLIAQPRLETELAVQSVPELRVGSGVSSAALGLRLRYEIRREIAPYVGVEWSGRFGETADFARADGDPVRSFGVAFGVRLWY